TRAESRVTTALGLARKERGLAERHLYAAQLREAKQAIDLGQVERAQDVLGEIRAATDGKDPREFAWHYLRALARQEIIQLPKYAGTLRHLRLSPGGDSLAYTTSAGEVIALDLAAEKPLLRSRGHVLGGNGFVFSPDG